METVEERFATSTPTTAALLPASIVRLDQPSTRVEPNPTPKIRRVTRQQPAWVLGARGNPPSPPHPFHPRFLHPYQHSPRRFLPPTLRHYLAFLRFSASVATTTPLLRFDPCLLHPPLSTPTNPAPFSPFFVISPLLSCPSSPLYYHSPSAAAPAAVATLPLFLSRVSNKHKFEELAYRRNSEGKYFLEIP